APAFASTASKAASAVWCGATGQASKGVYTRAYFSASLSSVMIDSFVFFIRIPAQLLFVTASLSCMILPATYHLPGRFCSFAYQSPAAQALPGEYILRCSIRANTSRILLFVAGPGLK